MISSRRTDKAYNVRRGRLSGFPSTTSRAHPRAVFFRLLIFLLFFFFFVCIIRIVYQQQQQQQQRQHYNRVHCALGRTNSVRTGYAERTSHREPLAGVSWRDGDVAWPSLETGPREFINVVVSTVPGADPEHVSVAYNSLRDIPYTVVLFLSLFPLPPPPPDEYITLLYRRIDQYGRTDVRSRGTGTRDAVSVTRLFNYTCGV